MFVDEVNFCAQAGDGGAGCVSFRREAHVQYGGPDGGDGGEGGDVWLVADRNTASLLAFKDFPHKAADSGTHGSSGRKHGRGGKSIEVTVPEGTVVRDHGDGSVLAELVSHGDRWLAGKGGEGGRGNARFLSNKHRAPSFGEQGEKGVERWYRLELKLIADVALVGFPNVGKSTLISVMSAAKPKIANYPFTTLQPHLGVVRYDDTEFVMADVPGLIEGAAEGKGLGHQFLRHVERARALLVMCDLAPVDGRGPEEQERILLAELGAYSPELLDRPRLVVGSRADMATPEDLEAFQGEAISAITGAGVRQLTGRLAALVDRVRAEEPEPEGFVVHKPAPEGVAVERTEDGGFRVTGRAALRCVALSDLTNLEALDYARSRLEKLGVDRALIRAGVTDGDTVYIGDFSFDFSSD